MGPVERVVRPLRAAYADPPYLGLAKKLYCAMHPDAAKYDKPETHQRLIEQFCDEYRCWAMSLHTPALKYIFPMCPDDVHEMARTKPFASCKPGVGVAYTWEAVIVRGRKRGTREQQTVRHYCSVLITLKRGFTGAKPAGFCFWMFEVLNLEPTDLFHDVFPGSGAVTAAWNALKLRNEPLQHGLFQRPNV